MEPLGTTAPDKIVYRSLASAAEAPKSRGSVVSVLPVKGSRRVRLKDPVPP